MTDVGDLNPTSTLSAVHGDVVLEYHHESDPRFVYLMTDRGFVLRSVDGATPTGYYAVNPDSLPEQVASVRESDYVVTRDLWDGPTVSLARPALAGAGRQEPPVDPTPADPPERPTAAAAPVPDSAVGDGTSSTTTGDDVTSTEDVKPIRWGARATRAIESELGVKKDAVAKAKAKAEKLARDRVLPNGKNDTMVRLWDAYEAAGVALPDGLAEEKKYFAENGKMKKGGGSGNSRTTSATPPADPPAEPQEAPSSPPSDETL